jgi:hypothetical protein
LCGGHFLRLRSGQPLPAQSIRITDLLTKGNDVEKPLHKKGFAGLSADDAEALAAAFVKMK